MKLGIKLLAVIGLSAGLLGTTTIVNEEVQDNNQVVYAASEANLTLPQTKGYTKSRVLKENLGTISSKDKQKLIKGSIAGMKENTYEDTDPADARTVDVTNLSHDDQVEISKFTLELINQVRNQFGKKNWTYSESSLKFANRIAKEYYDHDHSCWDSDHYVAGIERAAKASGLNSTVGQVYEDEAGLPITSTFPGHERTMKVLKEQIYFNLKQMLFGGFAGSKADYNDTSRYLEWEHAGDLLGLRTTNYNAKTKKFAVSFSGLKNDESRISVHMISVADRYIKNYKKFDR